VNRVRERLREPARALRNVFRNPNLRRIQVAFAGSVTGQYAFSIALAVYAYRHGGAGTVGLVIVVRMLPAAIVSPFAAVLADRGRRELVMLASDLLRAAAVGVAAAVVASGGPPAVVYAMGVVVTILMTVFHPAEKALLPLLAHSPEELSAANVSSSSIDSIGGFAGPAIGGLFLAVFSVEAAFVFVAATFLWSAFLIGRLRPEAEPAPAAAEPQPGGLRREALAGFRTIAVEPALRVIVGLYAAQTIVAGGLTVLTVVTALQLLGIGNGGVGYLNAAIGVGGIVGAALTLVLAGRNKLAGDFGLGIVLWGVPLLLIGLWPSTPLALAMLGAIGLGNTLVDVSALTLLQRAVDNAVLARVMGVVQALCVATMAAGALIAPALVSALGARGALVATGLFLPVLAALLWSRLAAIDRAAHVPARQLELLRVIPIFSPLAGPTLERLALALRPLRIAAGADVVREGDPGEDFYVIDSGEAEVLGRRLGPGESFGEIALLRDVPRTATVRAVTDLALYALDRETFVDAVTGQDASLAAANAVIGERLGALRVAPRLDNAV
jgi:predicted MFS family arabinose efflux permease